MLVALLSSGEHVPSLTLGELSPGIGQLSTVERRGQEKEKRSVPIILVSAVLRGVAGERWRGLGQKEMTLYIDLI